MALALRPEAIESGTGQSWESWLSYLDTAGAAQKSHQEIVELASANGAPSWWRQMIAVTYEQHIGRRVPGQRGDGSFSISASRTLPGSIDEALARWEAVVGTPDEIMGVAIVSGPAVSTTAVHPRRRLARRGQHLAEVTRQVGGQRPARTARVQRTR